MHEDDVLKEVWRAKEAIAARYGYDVGAIAQALRKRQNRDGRKVVSLEPKRPMADAKRQ